MFRNLPPVTLNLLLLNILVFIVAQVMVNSGAAYLVEMLPARYFNSTLFEPFQMVTHMFMHDLANFRHILLNMLLLVLLGSHLERHWGAKRYFIFYIACGLGAYLLYSSIGVMEIMRLRDVFAGADIDIDYINMAVRDANAYGLFDAAMYKEILDEGIAANMLPLETVEYSDQLWDYLMLNSSSMAGASGALFGVLGAFVILFPNTELYLMFIPVPVKAKYLIGGYILLEVYNSINTPGDHIAHLAHVGGAVVGIAYVLINRRIDRKNFW